MFTDSFLIFLGIFILALFICFIGFIIWLYVNYPVYLGFGLVGVILTILFFNVDYKTK